MLIIRKGRLVPKEKYYRNARIWGGPYTSVDSLRGKYVCGADLYDKAGHPGAANAICVMKKVGENMKIETCRSCAPEDIFKLAKELFDLYGDCRVLCDDGKMRTLKSIAESDGKNKIL